MAEKEISLPAKTVEVPGNDVVIEVYNLNSWQDPTPPLAYDHLQIKFYPDGRTAGQISACVWCNYGYQNPPTDNVQRTKEVNIHINQLTSNSIKESKGLPLSHGYCASHGSRGELKSKNLP